MITIICQASNNSQFNLNHGCECEIKEPHYHVNRKYLNDIPYFKDILENTIQINSDKEDTTDNKIDSENNDKIVLELPFPADYIYNLLCWITKHENVLYTLKDIKLGAFLRCDEYLLFILNKFKKHAKYSKYLEKYHLLYLLPIEVYFKCYRDCETILNTMKPIPELYKKIPELINQLFKDIPTIYLKKFYDFLYDECLFNEENGVPVSFHKKDTILVDCLILYLIKRLSSENLNIKKLILKPSICFYYAIKEIDDEMKRRYFDMIDRNNLPQFPINEIKYEENGILIYLEQHIIELVTDKSSLSGKLTLGKTIKKITRCKNIIDDDGEYFVLILYTDYTYDKLIDIRDSGFAVEIEC